MIYFYEPEEWALKAELSAENGKTRFCSETSYAITG